MTTEPAPQRRSSGSPTGGSLIAELLSQPPDPVDTFIAASLSGRSRDLPPEHKLLAAVLEQAIDDLVPKTLHDVTLPEETERWLLSDARTWPTAFAAICDTFGLEVDAARAAILARARAESALRRQLLANARTLTEAKGLRWISGREPWTVAELASGAETSGSTARKIVAGWLADGRITRAGFRRTATNSSQQYAEAAGWTGEAPPPVLRAVPQSPKPPTQTERAWTWAQQHIGHWRTMDLALGVGCPFNTARGLCADWIRIGRIERVHRDIGRTKVQWYRVRR